MNPLNEHVERRVIPIWEESGQAKTAPEMLRLRKSKKVPVEPETPFRLQEFDRSPSIETALDLVNAASREVNNLDVSAAAKLVLSDRNMPSAVRRLAKNLIGESPSDELPPPSKEPGSISDLRRKLKRSAANPLAWTDLSRCYASVGETEKSKRAMFAAVSLGGKNRWISRAASRLFVHLGEYDKALAILERNPALRVDPWLMAANVAVSQVAGKSPRYWKEAKRLLTGDFRAVHLGELFSAIATLEIVSGKTGQAVKFLRQSLVEPTGNVLAQAQWAIRARQVTNLDLSAVETLLGDASEAKYWSAYSAKDMRSALAHAKDWMVAEPYSSRPALSACYVGALLDNYDAVADAVIKGLRANSDNQTLRINRAFCAFASGSKSIAEKLKAEPKAMFRELLLLRRSDEPLTVGHADATLGLGLYRFGMTDDGRKLYDRAEEIFINHDAPSTAILCLQNHIREAILSGSPWTAELIARMKKRLEADSAKVSPGNAFYAAHLTKAVENPAQVRQLFQQPQISYEQLTSHQNYEIEVAHVREIVPTTLPLLT